MGALMADTLPTSSDETPIDLSALLPRVKASVRSRRDLNIVEAENIRHAVVKYLAARPGGKL